jgi:hypothetical protein
MSIPDTSLCTLVTPVRAASSSAASTPRRVCARVGAGTWRLIRPSADSLKMPVASPRASRTTSPPEGFGVPRTTPARRMAALLAHEVWPSTRDRRTGLSGAARSRISFVGQPPAPSSEAGRRVWSQPRPRIHSPGCACAAAAATRRSISASEVVPSSSTCSSPRPPAPKWMCASLNPGVTSLPARSTTSVFGPASRRTSASVPTASTRPSRTASACAMVLALSARNTRPPVKILSAASMSRTAGVCAARGVWRADGMADIAQSASRAERALMPGAGLLRMWVWGFVLIIRAPTRRDKRSGL